MTKSFKEYLEYLSELPYFDRRIDINNRFKPKPKRFIYKYKSIDINNNKSKDRIRDLLLKSKLWLSSPEQFNDPFDLSAKIIIQSKGKELRKRYTELYKQNGLSYKEREHFVKIQMRQPKNEFENTLQQIFKKNMEKCGVFSFAGDPRNILMWSHYSNNHTGLCIQFEPAKDILIFSGALPVDYTSEYPVIDWVNDFQNSMSNLLLRKYEGWSYEDEYRIIQINNAKTYLKFNPKTISRIILGCKVSSDIKQFINETLIERKANGLPPVQILYAKKHKSKYHLHIHSNEI